MLLEAENMTAKRKKTSLKVLVEFVAEFGKLWRFLLLF